MISTKDQLPDFTPTYEEYRTSFPDLSKERLDAYIADVKPTLDQSRSWFDQTKQLADLIYHWIVDNNVEVVCTLPCKH
jgi:hypothetical protein